MELATPEGSPVVLIHGENTLGKTQLFAALRWCLYGSFQPQQSATEATPLLRSRFNRIASRENDKTLEVQVAFTATDQYLLTRRAKEEGGRIHVEADLRVGHTVIPGADIDAEIGRLLHPQISEFFLFDAELLQRFYDRLNTDRERAFIRGSIESVLGIPALQLASHDVAELAEDAAKRQARVARDREEAERQAATIRRLSGQRKSLENDRESTLEKVRDAEKVRSQLREQMAATEGLQADAREQELLEAQSVDGEREEAELRAELRKLVAAGWLAAAAKPLSLALADVRAMNSSAAEQQRQIQAARTRVAVLEDRVRGGNCPTCGQNLPPADADTHSELNAARDALTHLLAVSGGGEVDLTKERRLASLVDHTTGRTYVEKQVRLNDLGMLQYERKRQLAAIADRLQGHRAADIRSLGQRLARIEQAVTQARQQVDEIDQKLSNVAVEEQAAMRKLTRLSGAQPGVVLEATFFSFARAAYEATIERYRERVRTEIESSANETFLGLIRDPEGYGGLRIATDYQIELLDRYGTKRETSEGGKQLLALSLIGALKHAAVRGGPVVIDSPLGRLDLQHRANVLQTWIPSLGNQAILLVQSGELTREDAHRLLGGTIGREYRIVRPEGDPEYAVIEEFR